MGEKQVKTKPLNSHSKMHARPGIAFIFFRKVSKKLSGLRNKKSTSPSREEWICQRKKGFVAKNPPCCSSLRRLRTIHHKWVFLQPLKVNNTTAQNITTSVFTKCSLFTRQYAAHIFEHFLFCKPWDKWTKQMA